jgi:DNA-binding NarL/FixJ family response regulator
MPSLPLVVIAEARSLAWRCGIDEASALSFTSEAWSDHPDPLWRTVAHRRCVDERRRLSGRRGPDHRPVLVLDEPICDVTAETVGGAIADDDHALEDVETRCDLVSIVAGLDDADLGRLARFYWLGVSPLWGTPAEVAHARAIRHARAQSVAKRIEAARQDRATAQTEPPAPNASCPLSARELQVLGLASEGLTREAIGTRLNLSANTTIKTHLARIATRLNAGNTTHAVAIALRAGWIT